MRSPCASTTAIATGESSSVTAARIASMARRASSIPIEWFVIIGVSSPAGLALAFDVPVSGVPPAAAAGVARTVRRRGPRDSAIGRDGLDVVVERQIDQLIGPPANDLIRNLKAIRSRNGREV